jgi:hypothetical protein
MTLTEIKRGFVPGQRYAVTNHYITREDHPCYGTREVAVERVTSGGLWLAPGGRVPWPKASQAQQHDGEIRFYGGGIAQASDEPFLTFQPIA